MPVRTQPYRLQWPLTPEAVARMDEMLEQLFRDLQTSAIGEGASTSGLTLPAESLGSVLYISTSTGTVDGLIAATTGRYLRSAGTLTAPVWSTLTLPNAATTGDLLYASATDTIASLAAVAAGRILRAAGVTTAPAYSTFTIPDTFTTGDLVHASATNTLTALAAVAAGRVLRAAGTGTAPAYSTFTIPTTFATGDLVHASATNTLTALAAVAAGRVLRAAGTGTAPAYSTFTIPDTFTTGNIVYASGTNILAGLTAVAVGQVLISGGVGTAPSWSANPTVTTITSGAGTAGAPSYTFTGNTNTGMYNRSPNVVSLTAGGSTRVDITAGETQLGATQVLGWVSSGSAGDVASDIGFARNAIGVVEVNSGTAGTLRDITLRNLQISTTSTFKSGSNTLVGTVADKLNLVHLATTSQAIGDIIYADAATTYTRLAKNATATRYLSNTGVANIPAWAQIVLTDGVSGVLPVANGGTNASTASITAFNNITGFTAAGATGTTSTNLVFSTSPTLVTPALGTPASGVLTNCTGLPVAGGGTGLSTVATDNMLTGNGTSALTAESNLLFDGTTLRIGSTAVVATAAALQVNVSGAEAIRINETSGTGNAAIRFCDNGVDEWHIVRTDTDNSLNFVETGVATVLALNSGGGAATLQGALTLTAGQIVFPGAQNASAGANTLDDYEEGTWTPTLAGTTSSAGITYGVQVGWYWKVGQAVACGGRITLTSKGTASGSVNIASLPFTSFTTTNAYGAVMLPFVQNSTTSFIVYQGYVIPDSTTARLTIVTAAATSQGSSAVWTDLSGTFDIVFTMVYRASA